MSRGRNRKVKQLPVLRFRLLVVLGFLTLACSALLARAIDIQVVRKDFYQSQGDARHLRVVGMPTMRGKIFDRNGEVLAVSTPVESVWVHPSRALENPERIQVLAQLLSLEPGKLLQRLSQRSNREFVYLKRHVSPELAQAVRDLGAPGVFLQREYRRYYPAGESTAHVLGFTNIDDEGQEGLELAYNDWLKGSPGRKRVIKDSRGRVIENVERLEEARPGRDLTLSIDRRLQYLAYRELKATVMEHGADSGSVVLLDAETSEVLAMVNYPSHNPNRRAKPTDGSLRNRAVTDFFEPGSVIKPFTVAAALESGQFNENSRLDTSPGLMQIGNYTVHDVRDFGVIDVTQVLQLSSNVGVVQLAAGLKPEHFWDMLNRFGFGRVTGSGFPGESPGLLSHHTRWRDVEQQAMAYGYGLAVTTLQLAQAFAVLANEGRVRAPSFIAAAENPDDAVVDPDLTQDILRMLESVTEPGGTGTLAELDNYRVAGKTGTSRKATGQGYGDRYVAGFGGVAPAANPRLVGVVTINDPKGESYYGGQVAAPLFSRVMQGGLRLLSVPPDHHDVALASNDGAGQ